MHKPIQNQTLKIKI